MFPTDSFIFSFELCDANSLSVYTRIDSMKYIAGFILHLVTRYANWKILLIVGANVQSRNILPGLVLQSTEDCTVVQTWLRLSVTT